MIHGLDETHEPARRSWVESANDAATDFPIQNLPFCMFSRAGEGRRAGVGIGAEVLDLGAVIELGLLGAEASAALSACAERGLNGLMQKGGDFSAALRHRLSELLLAGHQEVAQHAHKILIPQSDVLFHLPAAIGGFTDFFTSLFHTERGGRVSRPDNPVPANFRYMPIAYNSRASSVRISGEAVRRPLGQRRRADGTVHFGPCESLDFELELGAFIGPGNELGAPIKIGAAAEHIFGYCLVNDWSARDIQRWESFPLGPFLAKTLSTSISPFVVTAEALKPFRVAAAQRPAGDPSPLPYLFSQADQAGGGIDLIMEAFIQSPAMRREGAAPHRITRAHFRDMYWTMAQMVAHHTSNGCNLCPGDLIGSGTVSGPTDDSRACLAEIVAMGDSVVLPTGERRSWIEDGDTIVFRAKAERSGFVSIGFGKCAGTILPALSE